MARQRGSRVPQSRPHIISARPAPRARRRFGQHFLEHSWVSHVISAIHPQPLDDFLEIGPGRGIVTIPLASQVARIVAVEIDRDLTAGLASRLPSNVTLVERDFLNVDRQTIASWSQSNRLRVFGNLPYNVATPILFRLVQFRDLFSDATMMVQREVADRLTAPPGGADYGVLAILVGLYAECTRVLSIPPGAFRPMPKVHSALVRLTFTEPKVSLMSVQMFESIVRHAFTQRRKTIENTLRSLARLHEVPLVQLLEQAGVARERRPQTLDLADWGRLSNAFARASRQTPTKM